VPGRNDILRFSTDDVPADLRDDAWREITSPTYETSRNLDDAVPLTGSITSLPVDDMLFGRTSFGPQTYARTRTMAAATGLDCYLVQLFQHGDLVLHAGSEIVLGAGDLVVFDLARGFDAMTTGGSTVSVLVPRELLESPGGRGVHGTVLRRGEPRNALLTGFLRELDAVLFDGAPPAGTTLASIREATAAILAPMLRSGEAVPDASADLLSIAGERLRTRIEAYVDAHLGDPGLTPTTIARRFAISRATLYRLFDEGIAALVRDRRLDAARRRLLADPAVRISDVAYSVGMSSVRTFTRAFRDRFGVSPAAMREQRPNGWQSAGPGMLRPGGRQAGGARALHDAFLQVGEHFSPLSA
jgi:AraC-like DNA-binding protein